MPREDITPQEQQDVEGHGIRIRYEPEAPAEVEAHMPLRTRRGEQPEPPAEETGREQPPNDAEDDVEAHRVYRR